MSGGSAALEVVVQDFPVLFGRERKSHVHLPYGFISKTHAAIDLRDGKLRLRDLGALNRIIVEGKPVASNAEVELGERSGAFSIGQLHITVKLVEVDEAPESISTITGKPIAAIPDERDDASARKDPRAKETDASAPTRPSQELSAHFDRYREGWSGFLRLLSEDVARLSPSARGPFLSDIAQRYGAAAHEPEFRRILEQRGISADPLRISGDPLESKALGVLRMLASWYLDLPLASEGDIEQFGLRLRKTLDEFLRALVPLRDGLQISEQTVSGGHRPSRLDAVTTDAELADYLLNWQNAPDGVRDLRRFLSAVRIHQVGLMNGLMRGIEALLAEFAPSVIEADVKEGRAKGPKPVLGWGLHRALWEEFRRRHDDLASEEGGRFAVVFGPECAASYRQIAEELSPKTQTGAAVQVAEAGVGPSGTVVLSGSQRKA